MSTAQQHYDELLGSIYGWMLGDRSAAEDSARREFSDLGRASGTGMAIDLGAGTGVHSIPLAESGFSVLAVDTSRELLAELRSHAANLDIRIVHDDLTRFRSHCPEQVQVIACMGDTLTHLPSRQTVTSLFQEVKAVLAPGGLFVATFRDYMTSPPEGAARFIPVRSDENRILTCFLEYRETSVLVHDLLHTRRTDGWETRVSAYPKLRLDPSWLQKSLQDLGFSARLEAGPRGMIRLVGTAAAGRP